MVDTVLYLAYALGYLALLVWGLRMWRMMRGTDRSRPDASWVLYVVVTALVVDNAIVGLGRFIGTGPVLESMNAFRYWAHALFTPTLVLFSWSAVARAGASWARTRTALGAVVGATILLAALEVWQQTWGLGLVPERKYGLLRYVPADPAGGPPVMVLLITVALVVAGAVVWRRTGWPWMLVGAVVMTVGSVVPIPVPSAAVTNAFELVLLGSLVATDHHLRLRARRP